MEILNCVLLSIAILATWESYPSIENSTFLVCTWFNIITGIKSVLIPVKLELSEWTKHKNVKFLKLSLRVIDELCTSVSYKSVKAISLLLPSIYFPNSLLYASKLILSSSSFSCVFCFASFVFSNSSLCVSCDIVIPDNINKIIIVLIFHYDYFLNLANIL